MKNFIIDFKNVFFMLAFTIFYAGIFGRGFNANNIMSILLIINLSIYICGAMIAYKFNIEYIDSIHKNLILVFFGIGVMAFAYLYTLRAGSDNVYYFSRVARYNAVFSIHESISLIIAIKNYRKEYNFKTGLIAVVIISIIASYLCVTNDIDFILKIEDLDSFTSCSIRIGIALSKIYLLKLLYDIREYISKNLFRYLRMFLVSRLIVHIVSFVAGYFIKTNNISLALVIVIEYIAHYCILRIMTLEIIKNPYFNLYINLMKKSETLKNTSKELDKVSEEKETLSLNYERKVHEQEMQNELLTNISHEFKTPVNVIYAAIQMQDLLKHDLLNHEKNIEEVLKYNNIIKQNCNRLIRLINNFIDTTRLKRKNMSFDIKCFNLVTLTENIVMSVVPFAKSKKLDITFDTSDEEMYSKVDEQLFDRLILNLLSNAIKYSKEAGQIFVKLCNVEGKIEIIVKDQGIGISEDKYKIIFNRFERIDQTFSRNTEGSGLGLNIVNQIVKIFNGKIEIKSKVGVGTMVKVILPMCQDINDFEKECACENSYANKNHEHEVEIELSDIYI